MSLCTDLLNTVYKKSLSNRNFQKISYRNFHDMGSGSLFQGYDAKTLVLEFPTFSSPPSMYLNFKSMYLMYLIKVQIQVQIQVQIEVGQLDFTFKRSQILGDPCSRDMILRLKSQNFQLSGALPHKICHTFKSMCHSVAQNVAQSVAQNCGGAIRMLESLNSGG